MSSAFAMTLEEAIESPLRTEEYKLRDQYRHPGDTLKFFGIQSNMAVIELWPSRGWYSEILEPFLSAEGKFMGADFDPNYASWTPKAIKRNANLRAKSKTLSRMKMTTLALDDTPLAEKESVDMVLTFRNLHNWLGPEIETIFNQTFAALKPGGIFGVVEHRAKPGTSMDEMKKSGYVTENFAIDLARKVGFTLFAKSEINANPKDTKDHPKGVWTLPPSLGLKDKDKEKYLNIGIK